MPAQIRITDADVVLPDGTARGAPVLVEGDRITAVGAAAAGGNGVRELRLPGRIVLPGLIDLHSDAIERLVEGRPKVYFPLQHAIRESDRLHMGVGITTVFHAVGFAGGEFGVRDPGLAERIIRTLASEPGTLHRRRHVRFEISHHESVPIIEQLMEDGLVDLISFMDHSPGQGQYGEEGGYQRYLMRTYCMTQDEAEELIRQKLENVAAHSEESILRLLSLARRYDIAIAGHDLEFPADVIKWSHRGAVISEFPLNHASAITSRLEGLGIVMGAPNVVCGASSYKGLRAIDVISEGLGDILCSDYNPSCLLPALFRVASDLDMPLHRAVALATWKPADAVGMADAGRIAPGCRADLLVVEPMPWGPRLEAVMIAGQWSLLSREF